jgi:hypothetical protein
VRAQVTVISARGLPKMDLLHSCDAYCLLFLNEEGHDRYAAEYMQFLSQQRRTRVITSRSPVWEESFTLRITPMTKSLVLSVWDRDRLTQDDLVGCVEIQLEDLRAHPSADGLYPLVDSQHAARLRNAFMRVRTELRLCPAPGAAAAAAAAAVSAASGGGNAAAVPAEAVLLDASDAIGPDASPPQRRSAVPPHGRVRLEAAHCFLDDGGLRK